MSAFEGSSGSDETDLRERIAQLEARIDEQEDAMRRMLLIVTDYLEADGKRRL
ncbi:hypothetical protein [Qipengyuania atrilutea]|uniref:Uncharacterized protein n=1 Tax=Qipengyuania atrilutea TaxID=2744473 RepID=A0A850GZK8_9SPHN|nr:hypothetical protein [Actirhodobacter atriluteus]NVD43916.1 hypothetical protein [Actirhodobacter atriluteus]